MIFHYFMAITNHGAKDILIHISSCVNKFVENIPKSKTVVIECVELQWIIPNSFPELRQCKFPFAVYESSSSSMLCSVWYGNLLNFSHSGGCSAIPL